MFANQEMMSASTLLNEIREVPDTKPIRLPVVVSFSCTAQADYLQILSQLLVAKKPESVTLYKWPYRVIDEARLKDLYTLLAKAGVETVILDVRHLSSDLIRDLYKKSKAVYRQMTIKPLLMCDVMHKENQDYWGYKFIGLAGLPGPLEIKALPVFIPPAVSVTTVSVFGANKTVDKPPEIMLELELDDDDLEPPKDMMIEQPPEAPAPYFSQCSVM